MVKHASRRRGQHASATITGLPMVELRRGVHHVAFASTNSGRFRIPHEPEDIMMCVVGRDGQCWAVHVAPRVPRRVVLPHKVAMVSCSKQHAVLQYRKREAFDEDEGLYVNAPTPYVLDLDSVNGTFLNGEKIEPRRYYELMEKDTIKFGTSTREYVLLHEDSAAR